MNTLRKSRGYWSDETLIDELEIIINNLNHFPTCTELVHLGHRNILSAIGFHGGINKFRKVLGYDVLHKSDVAKWNDDKIISELNTIINTLSHFPKCKELIEINRDDLLTAIGSHGGINKFRTLLGYNLLHKPKNYWSDDLICNSLKSIISTTNQFPNYSQLLSIDKSLHNIIQKNGGIDKYKKILGYKIDTEIFNESETNTKINMSFNISKQKEQYTDDVIIKELDDITKLVGIFPTFLKLVSLGRYDLIYNIKKNGGLNKFKTLSNHKYDKNYYDDNKIIEELRHIIDIVGRFPTYNDLDKLKANKLIHVIKQKGKLNKFKKIMGYTNINNPDYHWSDETVCNELKKIISVLHRFPSSSDLIDTNKHGLRYAVYSKGLSCKYRDMLGFPPTIYRKYISELMSYVGKRGKRTEDIVKNIINYYCTLNNLSLPSYNVKLSKGNRIEFVCDINKRIGIDVTNTKSKTSHYKNISHKWLKKDYYKHLDELWIVVFSNIISNEEYVRLNQESPDNVKIMSIYTFLEELDYSIDETLRTTINKYIECTFHTKEELKLKQLSNKIIDINNINCSYKDIKKQISLNDFLTY